MAADKELFRTRSQGMPVYQLKLIDPALSGALILAKQFPDLAFTSGRRNLDSQAAAMAKNLILAGSRWIEKSYADTPQRNELQHWIDSHPAVGDAKGVQAGLLSVMSSWTIEDLTNFSRHFAGLAFDMNPVAGTIGDRIITAINHLPGKRLFLTNEGGLKRWHVEFNQS